MNVVNPHLSADPLLIRREPERPRLGRVPERQAVLDDLRPAAPSPHGRRITTITDHTRPSAMCRRPISQGNPRWKNRPHEASNETQDSPSSRRRSGSQVRFEVAFEEMGNRWYSTKQIEEKSRPKGEEAQKTEPDYDGSQAT